MLVLSVYFFAAAAHQKKIKQNGGKFFLFAVAQN